MTEITVPSLFVILCPLIMLIKFFLLAIFLKRPTYADAEIKTTYVITQ